ncbi:MAG: hypothetical protein JNK76_05830, partial [Planctomycetales bacterium]|nr:hypothetical protein [Planctomycetales bacterium]
MPTLHPFRFLGLIACLVGVAASSVAAEPVPSAVVARPEFRPEQLQFFRDRIQPILAAKCVKCHGEEEKVESNFFLTSRAAV